MSIQQNKRIPSPKSQQYDDWVCLMCQNLNYAFRKTCNRCRVQTKTNNAYLLELYQASAYLTLTCETELPQQADPNPQNPSSTYGQHSFPKYLFLELNADEQQQPGLMRRQVPELETPRWINCLIGE